MQRMLDHVCLRSSGNHITIQEETETAQQASAGKRKQVRQSQKRWRPSWGTLVQRKSRLPCAHNWSWVEW
jgi:hypothetical protein